MTGSNYLTDLAAMWSMVLVYDSLVICVTIRMMLLHSKDGISKLNRVILRDGNPSPYH